MTPPFRSHLQAAFEAAGGRPLAQAATVSPRGLPEVRTVVLRHLGEGGDPSFASDARSAKFLSLAAHPHLELCLWRPDAGVQLRLLGRVRLHTDDAHARSIWHALPAETRALFHAEAPGGPLLDGGPFRPPPVEDGAEPAPSFTVVRVMPQRCDRLELGPPLQRRLWSLQDGAWQARDVVP
ncbi:MAG: pyridoxamine 5'-phosphate oxidase family protein [Deinococcales bacterium]